MKEHPIIFNSEMVRAILTGKKTQTRRPIKPQPWPGIPFSRIADGTAYWYQQLPGDCSMSSDVRCPFGKPGDRLWVREAWGFGTRPDPNEGWVDGLEYRADEAFIDDIEDLPLYPINAPDSVSLDKYESKKGWIPSIHMPRWACRIVLEVTNIRVERVQSISEADAKAEGCFRGQYEYAGFPCDGEGTESARESFQYLWDSIYNNWDKNLWVWVVEFKKVSP